MLFCDMVEDKFIGIKVGDTVYRDNPVCIGWRQYMSFYVPVTVSRVTNKHFYVGDRMYRKKDGSIVNAHSSESVYLIGDNTQSGRHLEDLGSVVRDQTEDRALFVKKLELWGEISKLTKEVGYHKINGISIEDLSRCAEILKLAKCAT